MLDRYERSKLFREGSSAQRIQINVSADRVLSVFQEDADRKADFLDALAKLKEQGLVDYSWTKYERGNLVDRVWLITETESLKESYRLTSRTPRAQNLLTFEQLLKKSEEALESIGGRDGKESDIPEFLSEMRSELKRKKKIPRFFDQSDMEKNEGILSVLISIAYNDGEVMERVLSQRLFGNSKYFEHVLKSKILAILRYLAKKTGDVESGDDELLEQRGVVKWPEIIEFCGNLQLILDEGSQIDFSSQKYGAYVNSDTIRHLSGLTVSEGIRRIITIENKANYIWYISNQQTESDLVLYHGGFFSPSKGKWFRLIQEAVSKRQISFVHWSDIDLGGFRLYQRLKKEIFPYVRPWKMDLETLKENKERGMPITSEAYQKALADLLKDESYSVFADTIQYMLTHKIRLEQEVLI